MNDIRKSWLGRQRRFLAHRGIAIAPNDRRLVSLEGRHVGQRAFVLGMGPSLSVADLEMLKGEVTFSCNKIYLAFDETSWRPTYYSVCDILVAENNRDRILDTDFGEALPVHDKHVRHLLGPQSGACFFERSGVNMDEGANGSRPAMPANFLRGLHCRGFSIVMDMIQMAWLTGVREIILLGVDFSFELGEKTGRKCASGEVLTSRGEVNHFHPEYRKPGETWTVPKLDEQRRAFAYCRAAIEQGGGRLINASRQTKLDVVARGDLDELFATPVFNNIGTA